MVQIVEMTNDEKVAMYLKQPKKKLVEMLIQCNLLLEHRPEQLFKHDVSGSLPPGIAKEASYLLYKYQSEHCPELLLANVSGQLATTNICKCKKPWGVAGRCVVCEKPIG